MCDSEHFEISKMIGRHTHTHTDTRTHASPPPTHIHRFMLFSAVEPVLLSLLRIELYAHVCVGVRLASRPNTKAVA